MNINKVSNTNFGMATIKRTKALEQTLEYLIQDKHYEPLTIYNRFGEIHRILRSPSDIVEIKKFQGIWNGYNSNVKKVSGIVHSRGKSREFSVTFNPNDYDHKMQRSKSLPDLINAIKTASVETQDSFYGVSSKKTEDLLAKLCKPKDLLKL